jgi:hypothetical protein
MMEYMDKDFIMNMNSVVDWLWEENKDDVENYMDYGNFIDMYIGDDDMSIDVLVDRYMNVFEYMENRFKGLGYVGKFNRSNREELREILEEV